MSLASRLKDLVTGLAADYKAITTTEKNQAIALTMLGGQNLFYNSAMRLSSVAGVADGWKLDSPATPGASTGVLSLVPSFINADENAQRLTVTGLNSGTLYRSLMNDPLFPSPRVMEGVSINGSIYVKGTAGLGIRIYMQAMNSSNVAIATNYTQMATLDGTIQRFALAYDNLPAGTVRVQVFFRIYSVTVANGVIDFGRPMLNIGSVGAWIEDDRTPPVQVGNFSFTKNGLAAAILGLISGDAGYAKTLRFCTGNLGRWDLVSDETAEAGSNAGSNFQLIARSDAGAVLRTSISVNRATGAITMVGDAVHTGSLKATGPFQLGQFTTATRPSAAAYNGYEIDVTDTAAGLQRQRSNGTAWVASATPGAWTNLTILTGFTASTTHPPQYRIVNDRVELRGKFTMTNMPAGNTLYNFATLPAGFRPAGMTTDTEALRVPIVCTTSPGTPTHLAVTRLGALNVVLGGALLTTTTHDLSGASFSTSA